jgi:hypothetical protein
MAGDYPDERSGVPFEGFALISSRRVQRFVPWLAATGVAAVVALQLGWPVGSVAFDAVASTLHWERIVSGHHLETYLPTTPKPVLTVVYGPLYGLTDGWTAISWAAIGAFVATVALIAVLVSRRAGLLAGAFTAVALAGSPLLLRDAHLAHAAPWATVACGLAGWAALRDRPRWDLVGLALLAAALLRLELVVITGTALGILVLSTVVSRVAPASRRWRAPRGAWLVGLGLLAFPIMAVHDWLLIGDPLWWTTVSVQWSAVIADRVASPAVLAGEMVGRYASGPLLAGLALVGVVRIVRAGLVPLWVGLLGLGPGTLALFLLMTARGQYVNERYYISMDVAVIVAAAFGLGWVAERAGRAAAGASRAGPALADASVPAPGPVGIAGRVPVPGALLTTAGLAIAGILAVAATPGWAGFGTGMRADVRTFRSQAENARVAMPPLRAEVDAIEGARDWPDGSAPTDAIVVLPIALWPQASLDLDLPLTRFEMLVRADVDVASGYPAVGRLVLHDRSLVAARPRVPELEVVEPTPFGDVLVVPLLADPHRGVWLLRLKPAP